MKYLLLERGKGNTRSFIGVFEATDIKDAKTKLRVSKKYSENCFLSHASDPEITWFKHIKIIPADFNINNSKPIQL